MTEDDSQKRIERAEYRTKLIEAELNAIRSSRAYQLSKKAGIIKSQIQSDPIGLTKKAARMILTNPRKARHMLRSANHNAIITQSIAEQAAKYQEWILLNEPDEGELETQRKLADKLAYQPLISIVTPVFNPPLDVFEELIESVLEQTYANFELCLGNFGDNPAVDEMIARYAGLDDRIKHYSFTKNLGIAGNSNQILEKVTGEFIALLDHDDTLSPDALYENAKLLNEKAYDFIYSDKDKIDEQGHRFDPLFKAAISPEMLLNINYLTHLNVMRTSVVREIGGWDPETDGAQDWDLFLRMVDASKHIGFIPKVLYHWRVIATSTAMSIETKPYALANQCKAIDKFLASRNIPGSAYVMRTELFIKWPESALDAAPIVFIYHSNFTNTNRLIRKVRKVAPGAVFVLLVPEGQDAITSNTYDVLHYSLETVVHVVAAFLDKHNGLSARVALFMVDALRFDSYDNWYERMTGWLTIPDVEAASGRLINKHNIIVNSGGIVTENGDYYPLFKGFPRYYQSYIGNSEWIRNLSVLSPMFFATNLRSFQSYAAQAPKRATLEDYFLSLTKTGKRLVMSPHATAMVTTDNGVDEPRQLTVKKGFHDPYGSVNTATDDPLKLFDEEVLEGVNDDIQPNTNVDAYQYDATILAQTFDMTADQIAAARSTQTTVANPKSAAWLLPAFESAYAGLMNIFTFARYLSVDRGLKTTIYVLTGTGSTKSEQEAVQAAFPDWKTISFVAIRPDEIHKIATHDIGIATQWATTYPLAKATTIKSKHYFIQDNEVNFYPKGSISALVELSYRLGFSAIAGTDGLLEMYRNTYGGDGVVLKSKVDLSAYYPRKDSGYTPKRPYKVFFYARPNMPRNAFELGIAGLKQLKQKLGKEVEIITAGAAWDASEYGVEGLFVNLGKIDYDAVPKLYRSVDAGLMFMFSGHPGVTASELMASGCPVVVNEYDDSTWHELYQHEKTCVITTATASEVARNLERCLTDIALRKTIIAGGLQKSAEFYKGHDASMKAAFDHITGRS